MKPLACSVAMCAGTGKCSGIDIVVRNGSERDKARHEVRERERRCDGPRNPNIFSLDYAPSDFHMTSFASLGPMWKKSNGIAYKKDRVFYGRREPLPPPSL